MVESVPNQYILDISLYSNSVFQELIFSVPETLKFSADLSYSALISRKAVFQYPAKGNQV